MSHIQSQIGEVKVSHIYPKEGVKRASKPKGKVGRHHPMNAHDCAAERQI
jgi:hypothetical protein